MIERCTWAGNAVNIPYHDVEWGVPVHDDRTFFEFLILEGAQAGLSWDTVLRKRAAYRVAFDDFDPQIVARYDDQKMSALLCNEGIIRNRSKISSAVANARSFLTLQEEFGTFSEYIWNYVEGRPIVNSPTVHTEVAASTPLSDKISKDLKKRGFNFVGTTIIYSFLQATGLVNDHLVSCFRYSELTR